MGFELYHASTLKPDTIEKIHNKIKRTKFTYTNHALENKAKKRVVDYEIIVRDGKLIELKFDRLTRKHRALLRTPDGHCAVFSIKDGVIVTMWKNDASDNHRTINASKYIRGVNYLI